MRGRQLARAGIVWLGGALVVPACGNSATSSGGAGVDGGGDGAASNTDGSPADHGPIDGTVDDGTACGSCADGSAGDHAVPGDAPTTADAAQEGGDASTDAGAEGPCVPTSIQLAIVQTAGGQCAFSFTDAYQAGSINLLLTPGWGTVCFAGSSAGCGTGSSADGWWFSGATEISVCDATCARFYKQTIAGKLTVELGCPTEACMH